MNIQHILAIIIFIPVGFVAIGSAISLLCMPFHYLEDYLQAKRKTL
jgi:SNF family Na+-dependent transporter